MSTPGRPSLKVDRGGNGNVGTGATFTTAADEYAIVNYGATTSVGGTLTVGSASFATAVNTIITVYVGPSTSVSTASAGSMPISFVVFKNS